MEILCLLEDLDMLLLVPLHLAHSLLTDLLNFLLVLDINLLLNFIPVFLLLKFGCFVLGILLAVLLWLVQILRFREHVVAFNHGALVLDVRH